MRRLLAALLALLAAASPSASATLVIALSADEVVVTSNFTGTGITVFGAIEGGGDIAPWAAYDVAIILVGPPSGVVTRRKDSILGLWINRAEATFANVPEFYAVNATAPIADLADAATLAQLGVGLDHLDLVPDGLGGSADAAPFREALLRLKEAEGHFVQTVGAIENPGGLVFSTTFHLPADVPVGAYSIAVHLFSEGRLLASADSPFEIYKSSAEQFLFDASRDAGWLYALAVVAMAGAIGWLGGVIFRRD